MKDLLQAEFARRQQRNPRYSLRAFARELATHYASFLRCSADVAIFLLK